MAESAAIIRSATSTPSPPFALPSPLDEAALVACSSPLPVSLPVAVLAGAVAAGAVDDGGGRASLAGAGAGVGAAALGGIIVVPRSAVASEEAGAHMNASPVTIAAVLVRAGALLARSSVTCESRRPSRGCEGVVASRTSIGTIFCFEDVNERCCGKGAGVHGCRGGAALPVRAASVSAP